MKHPEIPSFIYRLFQWFCKDSLFEELEGDLEEKFLLNKEKYGLKKARRIYTQEVLKMIRPTILKRKTSGPSYQAALFASYAILALRNLRKHKLFSFINVFSLSIAMSTGLIVIGMISDLLKFDEFQEHKNEVYRVISTQNRGGWTYKQQATSPLPMAKEMLEQIPDIQISQLGRRLVGLSEVGEKKLNVTGIYADENFFDFLSFNLIRGKKSAVLNEPFSVVLSQSFATKVFQDKEPIGETMSINGVGTFKITGIVDDPPKFSHIQFEIIGSLSTVHVLANQGLINPSYNSWENLDSYYNYIHIKENRSKTEVLNWLKNTASSYYANPEEMICSFELQAINEVVPGKDLSDQIGPKMMVLPIIVLSTIAIAILLSAIFNYTNLSMARALKRAREVGVRKLNGATNKAVFLQFTIEAIILSLFSLGLGVVLFIFIRPGFLQVVPRASEVLKLELSTGLVLWFLLFAVVSGLIAGIAPSMYFARLSSLKALRSGGTLKTLAKINFRKGLIIGQFTLSIMFILAIVIANKQYTYSLNYDMGFDKENILNVSLQGNDPELLKTELKKLSEVSEVSFSSYLAGMGNEYSLMLLDPRNQDSVWVNTMSIDHSYISNFKLQLLAGRDFYENENQNQEQSIIVNETFVKNFGLGNPLDAVGSTFDIHGNSVEIVGVVKDFHYDNLEEQIYSFVFRNQASYGYANVKISSTDLLNSIEKIEEVWNEIEPRLDLDAQFFDDQIEDYYQFLVDIMKLFGFIGFLAISISCLGLFGMTIYSTETRLKEIGIRKTFGASEKTLLYLLTKGFLKLVIWGILIGTPICYFVFDQFILAQNFYRMEISFVEIGVSVVFLLSICLLTIVTQTWAAARTNPSEVLRNE